MFYNTNCWGQSLWVPPPRNERGSSSASSVVPVAEADGGWRREYDSLRRMLAMEVVGRIRRNGLSYGPLCSIFHIPKVLGYLYSGGIN